MNAADCGTSEVAGALAAGVSDVAAGAAGVGDMGEGPGENGLLLKLYANSFLQRAEGAHFFGSDERERAPG